ncbi:protein SPIRAL1-like 5-like [Hibiscus syriacus]|uniref:Protein SPIRAL1-like 5-like n=1 Tax=Hibiscus syriacus TaxID=106335 RepID=A0A6A2ZZY6_HIBSY|nr:protein SPIRAL1-like 5-like [Hibiscus syriacus]
MLQIPLITNSTSAEPFDPSKCVASSVRQGREEWVFRRGPSLPPVKISGDTSKLKYKNPKGHRSAIRISRIVSETLRLGFEDVRWFVMGDDDTFFVPENLVRVLSKYDHNQLYYIGSSSESHLQNINFSYGMAYGGGLYGSDDRIHACMAEMGVPLTKEPGFHQYDVYGSLLGLLSAHPVAPLISIHHLDVVEPIFPNVNRVQALQRLKVPINLDSAAIMQQSVCYDKTRSWTVSVSWGYAVQIYRGIFSVRELEMPARTFLNWHKRADYTGFSFNTRPVAKHACQRPFVFYLSNALYNKNTNQTASEYAQHRIPRSECNWKMADPSRIEKVHVYKSLIPICGTRLREGIAAECCRQRRARWLLM